jgi:hypothetical protein
MPKHSRRPEEPDVNQLAARLVAQAIGTPGQEMAAAAPPEKNPAAAVALGRLGGLKGGKARAGKLLAAKRKAIAKKGAEARWGKADKTR